MLWKKTFEMDFGVQDEGKRTVKSRSEEKSRLHCRPWPSFFFWRDSFYWCKILLIYVYLFLIHLPSPSFIFLLKQWRNILPKTKIENTIDVISSSVLFPISHCLLLSSKNVTVLTLAQIAGLGCKYSPSELYCIGPKRPCLSTPASVSHEIRQSRKDVTSGDVTLQADPGNSWRLGNKSVFEGAIGSASLCLWQLATVYGMLGLHCSFLHPTLQRSQHHHLHYKWGKGAQRNQEICPN